MREVAFLISAACRIFGQSMPAPAILTRPSVRCGSSARSASSTAAPASRLEISASTAASCAAPFVTPSHSARGFRLLGKVPMPRHCTSNGASGTGGASSGMMRSTSAGSTSPRNRIVTWSAAGFTHTTFGGVFAASSLICSALTTRAASRRTASPTSTATNTRTLVLDQKPPQHVDRPVRRHGLHDVASARKAERTDDGGQAVDGNAYGADRFLFGAAAWTGNARDGDADVDAGALADPRGHSLRDRLAHSAVFPDQRLRHIQ